MDACLDIGSPSPAIHAECELLQCSMGSSLVTARGHVASRVCPSVWASVPSVSRVTWCARVLSECALHSLVLCECVFLAVFL